MIDIICFSIIVVISVFGIIVTSKMKLPVWKFQIGIILFIDVLAVLLLVSRIVCEQ